MLEKITNTVSFIRSKTTFKPQIGIILGSGLGGLADHIEVVCAMDYCDIPNFPVSTVEGHKGRLIMGMLAGKAVVAMQGRFHYYEGYTPQEVVFPVRVMKLLGIEMLVVSNAAGGVNPDFEIGNIMIIEDHVNFIPNPLIGKNINELGVRFPNMTEPYDHQLIALAQQCGKELGVEMRMGCYIGFTGPSLDTQGEYRFARTIGGDAVGMSTTPEVIAARHAEIPVLGFSVITNVSCKGSETSHEQVQAEARKAQDTLVKVITKILAKIKK